MNPRERYIETLEFGNPDRIPLLGIVARPGGRKSTLDAWHQQGLPPDVDVLEHLWEILGIDMDQPKQEVTSPGVTFEMIPHFEERILEHRNGHYVVQDRKGNICEISDQIDPIYLGGHGVIDFVTRAWLKCPVENRADWEQMKSRYDLDAPGRFPDDFAERGEAIRRRDYFLQIGVSGPFWQLREWCGFEELCIMMAEQPDFVAEMSRFWQDFVSEMLKRIFEHVVPDVLHISEDMAYKTKSMISPDMTRQFCKPSWDAWSKQAKVAGVPIVSVDSDGFIGELIPTWIESGINCCDPIEVAAGCDINEFRRAFGHKMAYRGGIGKRCMAQGGAVIRAELKRIEPVLRDGGYIPDCDHGIPPDVSWPNFVDFTRLLAQMTGWL